MSQRPIFVSPIICPVDSQPCAQRGRPILLRLPARPPHSVGVPSCTVSFEASSLRFVPTSSIFIELPFLAHHLSVNLLEPELATILTDSTTSDKQPLPSFSIEPWVVVHDLHLSSDLHDREWPPGWESHHGKHYQLGTVVPSMIAVSTARRRYWDANVRK